MKGRRKEKRELNQQHRTRSVKSLHGCVFVVQTKAGLVNHVRQRHDSMVMVMEWCDFCDKACQKQEITMHSIAIVRRTPTGR